MIAALIVVLAFVALLVVFVILWRDDMTWYLATCLDCEPVLSQPFSVEAERALWTMEHVTGTGHRVVLSREVRT